MKKLKSSDIKLSDLGEAIKKVKQSGRIPSSLLMHPDTIDLIYKEFEMRLNKLHPQMQRSSKAGRELRRKMLDVFFKKKIRNRFKNVLRNIL